MREVISFTKVKLAHGWLGNMSRFAIEWDGRTWPTTENLFQAMRFKDFIKQEEIRAINNPFASKLKAKSLAKDGGYDVEPRSEADLDNMRICIRLKLEQHPDLKGVLRGTGDTIIHEDVTARGRGASNMFWGALLNKEGEWEGESWLGRIWEEERAKLEEPIIQPPLF